MLIPSIDLMGGKIVQLVQGEKKALDFTDFEYWINRFSKYPLVQLIDLDAAIGTGDNSSLVAQFVKKLPCQVGGGVRSIARAQELVNLGARRVIIGSALFKDGKIQTDLAKDLSKELTAARLTFGVDTKQGKVAIHGWRTLTAFTAPEAMEALNEYCDAFLYTNVDTEGLMKGFPMNVVSELKAATTKKVIVAGGVTTIDEINQLDRQGVDAIVGMAIYTGKLDA